MIHDRILHSDLLARAAPHLLATTHGLAAKMLTMTTNGLLPLLLPGSMPCPSPTDQYFLDLSVCQPSLESCALHVSELMQICRNLAHLPQLVMSRSLSNSEAMWMVNTIQDAICALVRDIPIDLDSWKQDPDAIKNDSNLPDQSNEKNESLFDRISAQQKIQNESHSSHTRTVIRTLSALSSSMGSLLRSDPSIYRVIVLSFVSTCFCISIFALDFKIAGLCIRLLEDHPTLKQWNSSPRLDATLESLLPHLSTLRLSLMTSDGIVQRRVFQEQLIDANDLDQFSGWLKRYSASLVIHLCVNAFREQYSQITSKYMEKKHLTRDDREFKSHDTEASVHMDIILALSSTVIDSIIQETKMAYHEWTRTFIIIIKCNTIALSQCKISHFHVYLISR